MEAILLEIQSLLRTTYKQSGPLPPSLISHTALLLFPSGDRSAFSDALGKTRVLVCGPVFLFYSILECSETYTSKE